MNAWTETELFSRPVQCKSCRHAITTDHPVLVRCGQQRPSHGFTGTWWSEDWIYCTLYEPDGAAQKLK